MQVSSQRQGIWTPTLARFSRIVDTLSWQPIIVYRGTQAYAEAVSSEESHMPSLFQIGDLRVEPGTRAAGWLPIARMPSGGSMGTPVVVLRGAKEGPVVVVDAATHGDEYEGTLSLLRLLREVDPASLRGTLVGVPVLNGPSFDAEVRGNPRELHHFDLNRTFPGEAGGSITQRLAATYFNEVVRKAQVVVSLHGGGNVFYLDGFVIAHTVSGSSLDVIKAWGWKRFTDHPDVAVMT